MSNEGNRSDEKDKKIIFRAEQGDEKTLDNKKAESRQIEKKPKRDSHQTGRKNRKKKKRRRSRGIIAVLLIALFLLLSVAGVFVAYMYGTYNYFLESDELLKNTVSNSYEVGDEEKLVEYLKHPALREGDTIKVTSHLNVDVEDKLGGFLSMGLINFDCSSGSLTLSGGTVIMASGRDEEITMDGVSIDNVNLYIEAPFVDLMWNTAPASDNINVRTLNGSSHLNQLSIPAVGAKMKLPMTLQNISGSVQKDIQVKLMSPSFLFVDGDSITVSLEAGESKAYEFDVIAIEGGRVNAYAVGLDSNGNEVVNGKSDYLDILGGGFYSGDPHTHTVESFTPRYNESSVEKNVQFASQKGHSFIFSVENDDYGKKLDQSEVDAITGSPGTFLQLSALEVGGKKSDLRHLLAFNYYGEIPDSHYYVDPFGSRLVSDSLYEIVFNEVNPGEAFVYVPHPFGLGVPMESAIKNVTSLNYVQGMEILESSTYSDWTEYDVGRIIWDSLNTGNRNGRAVGFDGRFNKIFGIGASNNLDSEHAGSRYTKGYMDYLSEDNIYSMLRDTGNMFISNGPELRFTLGNIPMGGDLRVNPGEEINAEIYVHSENPITEIKLMRYEINGKVEKQNPFMDLEEYFEGQNVYSFHAVIPIVPAVDESGAVIDQFYRVEVYTESAYYYDGERVGENREIVDRGIALSNPIWVAGTDMGSNDTSIIDIGYEESPPVGIFGLDIDLSFLNDYVKDATESFFDKEIFVAKLSESDNGSIYVEKGDAFAIKGLKVEVKDNQIYTINYHKYNSEVMADKITISVTSDNRSKTFTETIYIVS
ncbi:MAG: hypothetical protein GX222_02410 [Ruminococcaceae bacterium]|nr:hypothetical protein [Oscillospiraceae bacterium]